MAQPIVREHQKFEVAAATAARSQEGAASVITWFGAHRGRQLGRHAITYVSAALG